MTSKPWWKDWVMGERPKTVSQRLLEALKTNDLGYIRQVVFWLYRGNANDPMLFALCDKLNGPESIESMHAIYKFTRRIADKLNNEG